MEDDKNMKKNRPLKKILSGGVFKLFFDKIFIKHFIVLKISPLSYYLLPTITFWGLDVVVR